MARASAGTCSETGHEYGLSAQVPLLVLVSGVPSDAVATFMQQLLSSHADLTERLPAHRVLQMPASTFAAFPKVLSSGLQWLASEAPCPPQLQACLCCATALTRSVC